MLTISLFLLLQIVAVASDNAPYHTSSTFNDANGQCSYTLTIPSDQCTKNYSDQKLSARLNAIETRDLINQQRLRQQELKILAMTNKLQDQANSISEQTYRIQILENTLKEHGLEFKKYKDCAEYRLAGQVTSGVYNITLEHALAPISVWCDMDTEKGGWTLFQRRQDGSVYFFRDWDAYKKGFGNIDGEYWLGNDNIYHLTNQKKYLLRVDLWDFDNNHYWAEYDDFSIENELHKYVLHIGAYRGTAGDGLSVRHKGMAFSTKQRDNDKSPDDCAYMYKGAFWYESCYSVNLNGMYHSDKYVGTDSINWYQVKNDLNALKRTEMKMRPMTFHR